MEAKTETKTLPCKLTEAERIAYRAEVAETGIALGEIKTALKAKLGEIKVARERQETVLDALKFGQLELDEKDDHGRCLLEVVDAGRREQLEQENLELSTELDELTEERGEIHSERKVAQDTIKTRLRALKFGQEDREVECEWSPNISAGKCMLIRLDTMEVIDSRPLADAEKQRAFAWETTRAMIACPVCPMRVAITDGVVDDHKDLNGGNCVAAGLTTAQAATLESRVAAYEHRPDAGTLELLRAEVVAANPTTKPARAVEDISDAGDDDELSEDDLSEDPFLEAELAMGIPEQGADAPPADVVCPVCGIEVGVDVGLHPWESLADHTADGQMQCVTSGLSFEMAVQARKLWESAGSPVWSDDVLAGIRRQAILASSTQPGAPRSDERTETLPETRVDTSSPVEGQGGAVVVDIADVLKTALASLKLGYVADIFPRHIPLLMEAAGPSAAALRTHLLEDQVGVDLKATVRRSLTAWAPSQS